MKKILVVYYSMTGNTRKVAKKIAKMLKADVDEIVVVGKHKMFTEANITYKKDPEKYDLVIVGTPVWAWTLTPAVKKYLEENKGKIKNIAFFYTYTGFAIFILNAMKKLSKKPLAKLGITERRLDSCEKKIKQFCEKIK